MVSSRGKYVDQGRRWEFIKCTTKLLQAGIKFEKATKYSSFLDIKFENGILKIPHLVIFDETELLFRNLIAYEQYNRGIEPFYLTDYATFIDCLINSPKDAEKLRHYGIIDNWLGDDEVVSTMFNKLGNYIIVDSATFCYSKVFKKVKSTANVIGTYG
ncbi:unnamed protein product [Ilex paraguariensis]|uniref:Uncharacterized protein n=1 Tax=Ilex paraguariensis TaxID=185542 RepID=A0ABC8V2F3_9AQUA